MLARNPILQLPARAEGQKWNNHTPIPERGGGFVSSARSPLRPGIALLGVPFERLTLNDAVKRIQQMVASGRSHYVVTPNVDFLVQARHDAELRRILIDAHLAVCDGTPLRWASRLLGNPLPERVAGSDLVPELIRVAAVEGYRLFFLGGSPEANAQAVANMRARYPGLQISGYSPPFRPLQEMNHDAEIAERIAAARPDLLFVAFGCPKAEKWIASNYQLLGVPVTMGVGATVDFLAGRVKRAPHWMRTAGVEWLFRLGQEPRRLFRRYVTDLWDFSRAFTAQWWRTQAPWQRSRRSGAPVRSMVNRNCERVQLPERLDVAVVRRGARVWRELGSQHCLLELAQVRFIDSTGVALLLSLRRRFVAAGKSLVLLAPSRAVQQALATMRIEDRFVRAENIREAREFLEPSRHQFKGIWHTENVRKRFAGLRVTTAL